MNKLYHHQQQQQQQQPQQQPPQHPAQHQQQQQQPPPPPPQQSQPQPPTNGHQPAAPTQVPPQHPQQQHQPAHQAPHQQQQAPQLAQHQHQHHHHHHQQQQQQQQHHHHHHPRSHHQQQQSQHTQQPAGPMGVPAGQQQQHAHQHHPHQPQPPHHPQHHHPQHQQHPHHHPQQLHQQQQQQHVPHLHQHQQRHQHQHPNHQHQNQHHHQHHHHSQQHPHPHPPQHHPQHSHQHPPPTHNTPVHQQPPSQHLGQQHHQQQHQSPVPNQQQQQPTLPLPPAAVPQHPQAAAQLGHSQQQTPQQQLHHQQQQPTPHLAHHTTPQHAQQQPPQPHHHQTPQQQQQQQQHPPLHHMGHPQGPPPPPPHMMLNQQYPSPNFLYAQMGAHAFVPPPPPPTGPHVPPPYEQSPASASHQQPEQVSISSTQQPVSISNQPPASVPLSTMPSMINTATPINTAAGPGGPGGLTPTTGTTSVHHNQPINGAPMMDPHMSPHMTPHTRMPLNQQAYMMQGPYLQSPFNVMLPYLPNLNPYPGAMAQPLPPMRVGNELGMRPPFDLHNHTTPLPPTALNQTPGTKPPLTMPIPNLATPNTAPTPIRPRERKALAIVHPETKHVFSVDELKGSPAASTPQNQVKEGATATTKTPAEITSPPTLKEPVTDDKTTTTKSSEEVSVSTEPKSSAVTPATKPSVAPPQQDKTPAQAPPSSSDTQTKPLAPVDVEVKSVNELPTPAPVNEVKENITPLTTSVSSKRNTNVTPATSHRIIPINVIPSTPLDKSATGKLEESQEKSADVTPVTTVDQKELTSTGKESSENGKKESPDTLAAKLDEVSISASESPSDKPKTPDNGTAKKQALSSNLPYAAGQYSPLNRNGIRRYTLDFLKAVRKEMHLDLNHQGDNNKNYDFAPHYINQNNYGNFSSSQNNMGRNHGRQNHQPPPSKPKKVIIVAPNLHEEVELKTAEKPWKPELETDKSKSIESGQMDTTRLLKVFRGHLNKLTPQNYDSIIQKMGALDLDGPERLASVIDLVFDKAVDEPEFCELYAKMCKAIAGKDNQFSFHLIKKCQDKFEGDLYSGLNVDERRQAMEVEKDSLKKKLLFDELYEDMRLRRAKYLGTIKLIGEMYKINLLLPGIIFLCMKHLLDEANNENIECLCSLLTTVGLKMTLEKDNNIRTNFKAHLSILHDLVRNKKADEIIDSRIRFKIMDTLDLSRRNWKPKMR